MHSLKKDESIKNSGKQLVFSKEEVAKSVVKENQQQRKRVHGFSYVDSIYI